MLLVVVPDLVPSQHVVQGLVRRCRLGLEMWETLQYREKKHNQTGAASGDGGRNCNCSSLRGRRGLRSLSRTVGPVGPGDLGSLGVPGGVDCGVDCGVD